MTVGRPSGQNGTGLAFLTEIPLRRLITFAKPRTFEKGTQISDGSELTEAAWFLVSGSCELRTIHTKGGPETITNYTAGEAFGALGEGETRIYQIVAAATTDSILLCFDRTTLELIRGETQDRNGNGNGHLLNGKGSEHPVTEGRIVELNREVESLPNQIVTLGYLSDDLPTHLISEQLAKSLQTETENSVVLLRFSSDETAGNVDSHDLMVPESLATIGGMRKTESGYYRLTLRESREGPTPATIDSLLNQLRHFRYVLIEVRTGETPAPWLFELLARSDLAYLFLRPKNEAVYHLDQVVRQARIRDGKHRARLKAIACLGDDEQIEGFDLLADKVGCPVHFYVRGCPVLKHSVLSSGPGALFQRDVRRLAREVGGRMVGLALSSGAAKGFAHIGVIQVLEENGLEIDVVAGSSMGAYVGCLWAWGADGAELERLARELEGRWKLWSLVDPVFPPRQGFLRGFAVKRRLERSIGAARFADMVTPLRVVATNLNSLERKVFGSGEVSMAVHASIAVPGICVPITIDGETYIDGGIMDPLPVEVLREMGVSRVIGVDAIPSPEKMRYAVQAEAELAKQKTARKLFKKVIPIDQQLNYFARGNLFEILMRSVHGAQIRVAEASCRQADLLLRPDILDDRWLDFRHPGKFITLGREVALRHLDELKALVAGKHDKHEYTAKPMAVFA